MPALSPYSRPAALAKLDGRTKEARLMRETRAELLAHVGNRPSVTECALIERLVQLTLRIATMDRKFAETGAQSEHDSRTYLAWVGTYSRLMTQLGLKAAPAPVRTLADHLAGRAAA